MRCVPYRAPDLHLRRHAVKRLRRGFPHAPFHIRVFHRFRGVGFDLGDGFGAVVPPFVPRALAFVRRSDFQPPINLSLRREDLLKAIGFPNQVKQQLLLNRHNL